MNAIAQCVRAWLTPRGPTDLAVSRMAFFGLTLLFVGRRDMGVWAYAPDSFWMPLPSFLGLGPPALDPTTWTALTWAWRASLLLACVGLATRTSALAAGLLSLFLLGVPQGFGKIDHGEQIVVIPILILAASRCGDAWALDAWLRRRRGRPSPGASAEYTWPLRLIQTFVALVFFSAGVAKLRRSGTRWFLSDNLSVLLWVFDTPLGRRIAPYTLLTKLMAFGAVVMETAAPIVLFSRRARFVLLPGLFMLNVAILALLDIRPWTFLIAFVFWAPWQSLVERTGWGRSSERRPQTPAHVPG